MKKYYPLLGGSVAIVLLLFLPIKTKFLAIQVVLLAIPLITYEMREKNAGDRPYHGGLQGGIIGGFVGAVLDCIVMNLFTAICPSIQLGLIY